jgi:outer membrane lipoprotein-sorting protein
MSKYSADPPSATRAWKHRIMKQVWLAVLLVAASVAAWSQSPAPVIETAAPDLDATLQSVERTQQQNPAQSRPYELTRKYKVFHADDKQPVSEVTAQVSFTPPDKKTYKITQASGKPRGEKIVRAILDQETEAAKNSDNNQISRANYDFVFLRRENFGVIPEYVLLIIPKRKAKTLLLGQIWVDASTFRIRRIEGIPTKNPSIWIKNIHITMQFAELSGAWIPVSFDAIASIRLLGQYTLTGLNVAAPTQVSIAP